MLYFLKGVERSMRLICWIQSSIRCLSVNTCYPSRTSGFTAVMSKSDVKNYRVDELSAIRNLLAINRQCSTWLYNAGFHSDSFGPKQPQTVLISSFTRVMLVLICSSPF